MKPEIASSRTPAEEASEERDAVDALFEPRTASRPEPHYRIAGDSEARAAELEQELAEVKAKLHDAEHEVYAARRKLEKRRALGAVAIGGLGSMVGSLVGVGLDSGFGNPTLIAAGSAAGFVLGLLGAMRWDPPNDDFPKAPPPRFQ